jgi:hypothetical protein
MKTTTHTPARHAARERADGRAEQEQEMNRLRGVIEREGTPVTDEEDEAFWHEMARIIEQLVSGEKRDTVVPMRGRRR